MLEWPCTATSILCFSANGTRRLATLSCVEAAMMFTPSAGACSTALSGSSSHEFPQNPRVEFGIHRRRGTVNSGRRTAERCKEISQGYASFAYPWCSNHQQSHRGRGARVLDALQECGFQRYLTKPGVRKK